VRPVDRPPAPAGATTYEEMSPALREGLGEYCSYCEYPIRHVPHAEHIVPKDKFPASRDQWDNLLLACSWCNGHKGKDRPRPQDLGDYLLPDRDNTARAFDYANVVPVVAPTLSMPLQAKAARTRGMVKLNVGDDQRAMKRAAVYVQASSLQSRMQGTPDPSLVRDLIVALAQETGFFSVWMEVFRNDEDMRRRLIAAFPGTARSCFDPTTTACRPRLGGQS